jgi:DNA-directed RNA polymerase specialized sigma subunit
MNIVENNDLDNNILCHEVLTIAKSVLSERELDILIDYTLTSITYNELGREYGISGNRIMQIINKSKRKVIRALSYIKMVYKDGRYIAMNKNVLFDCESVAL